MKLAQKIQTFSKYLLHIFDQNSKQIIDEKISRIEFLFFQTFGNFIARVYFGSLAEALEEIIQFF